MPEQAKAEPAATAEQSRRAEKELDYALNQIRVMRAQLGATGAPGISEHGRPPRRRLHALLDRIQGVTPEFARALVRRYYLKYFYYRLYPQHSPNAAALEPAPAGNPGLAHSGYAPFLAFKQGLCGSLPMEFATVSTTSQRGLISIVLPVYNGEKYVAQAIDSVLGQSYADLELIIINDGSTDSTPRILERYAAEGRVRVFEQPNQALPAALNAGFRRARGEFFTWTSADNIMHREMLQVLVEFLRARPDVELVYGNEDLIDERGLPACGTDFNPGYQTPQGSNLLRRPLDPGELNFVQNNYIGACFLYRAWAARLAGEYDRGCFGFEDYDYWMRMNALFRIAPLREDRVLYSYRLHAESLSAREKELRISERARYFLPIEAERRRFFAEPFDVEFRGEHPWFGELVSLYRRSGHNARRVGEGANGHYVGEMTRAFRKRIVIGSEPSEGVFAVLVGDRVRGPDFELRGGGPAAVAWPVLAAANSRFWRSSG